MSADWRVYVPYGTDDKRTPKRIERPEFRNLGQARKQTEDIERRFVHNRADNVYYYRDYSELYQVFEDGGEWIASHYQYDFGYVFKTRKEAYDFVRGEFTADIDYWNS